MWSFYGIFFALLAYRSTLVVAGTVNIQVIPSQTYSGIPDKYGNNAVIYDLDKMATNPPKILVYLPGTNSKVQGAINFLESAVSSGYLVVGIAYINKTPMGVYCRSRPMDIECYWDSRRTVIQGVQYPHSGPTVNKDNSVVWRLYNMLIWIRDTCTGCDPVVKSLITNVIAPEAPYQPPMYGSGIVWKNIAFFIPAHHLDEAVSMDDRRISRLALKSGDDHAEHAGPALAPWDTYFFIVSDCILDIT